MEWGNGLAEGLSYLPVVALAILLLYAAAILSKRKAGDEGVPKEQPEASLNRVAESPVWEKVSQAKRISIVIDPGHGSDGVSGDPGAVDPLNEREEDDLHSREDELAFDIAVHTALQLDLLGYEAILSRQMNQYVGLEDRSSAANKRKAAAFVSIHLNAGPPQASGFEAYSFPGSVQGAALRDAILGKIATAFPLWRNRGGKEARFAVLRQTSMPAVLVECGFITNVEEERELHELEVRKAFGKAIAEGINVWMK